MSSPRTTGPVVSDTGAGLVQSSPGITQRPAEHDCRVPQTCPHPPQFRGSVARLVQAPEHAVPPLLHPLMLWQKPLEHVWLLAHWVPHDPQLFRSVWRFTQDPLQLAKPAAKQLATHTLAAQFCVVPEQVVVHAPQCVGSFVTLISHPFNGLPSQSA